MSTPSTPDGTQKHHRISSKLFSPSDFRGDASKSLRWFRDGHFQDWSLRTLAEEPDGTFILLAMFFTPSTEVAEGEIAQMQIKEVSLDQATVDKIEERGPRAAPGDYQFLIFERSSTAAQSYGAKGQ